MQNPFRRPETPSDDPDRHRMTLDLIEEVAELRGRVRSMNVEWDDIRAQIKKGYQRMEKAFERLEKAQVIEPEEVQQEEAVSEPRNFIDKLKVMNRT